MTRATAAGTMAALGLLASAGAAATAYAQEVMSKEILAVQIRKQGFSCDTPLSAARDAATSKPADAMWTLVCTDGRYHVRLIPKMAAEVTRLE